ncbi:hypothetical protein BGC07_16485 [Piscirickettsia litoralis]|uniref:Uncharacterized protein n=1 Tax=Piscirickettsia litoralis TaxID=1891921 RepID=A0ABX2ZXN0_9GAMM|nr:hypothetical protein BGC07_16485 [Piscirickettsia litoralis]
MFFDSEELAIFKARAVQFFQSRPDLLEKLRKHKGTLFWTQKELSLFDRTVFDGCNSAGYA